MSIYIYRSQPSDSARLLADAVEGYRVRGLRHLRSFTQADHLVCWGDCWVGYAARHSLNNRPLTNKFADAQTLAAAGVATIEVSRERPAQPHTIVPTYDFREAGTNILMERPDVQQLIVELQAWLVANPERAPFPEWLPRSRNHVGGDDLLHGIERPDYFSKKEDIAHEYRVHSFLGRSLRAGKKSPIGENPHPWIRSMGGGWKIIYDGVSVRQRHRDIAHAAVKALGLDFGAVDIAEQPDGRLFVLEVNRAPGLADGTAAVYAHAIRRWVSGEWERL